MPQRYSPKRKNPQPKKGCGLIRWRTPRRTEVALPSSLIRPPRASTPLVGSGEFCPAALGNPEDFHDERPARQSHDHCRHRSRPSRPPARLAAPWATTKTADHHLRSRPRPHSRRLSMQEVQRRAAAGTRSPPRAQQRGVRHEESDHVGSGRPQRPRPPVRHRQGTRKKKPRPRGAPTAPSAAPAWSCCRCC